MSEPQQKELTPEIVHQRQVFFRIYVPVIIASLILIALITFLVLSLNTYPTLSQIWAHISVIMLVVPAILLFLVMLTLLSLAVFGMYKVNKILPGHLRKIRDHSTKINNTTQQIISKAASPVITTRSFFTGGEALFSSLKSKLTRTRRK
jgi:hypothetical protein